MLSSITNKNQNDNYAWMLLIYFPHDHGFRERMTTSTIIRRMIIAASSLSGEGLFRSEYAQLRL
jgi:hypothetical protein